MPLLAAPGLLIILIALVGMATIALSRQSSSAWITFLKDVARGAQILLGPVGDLSVKLARYVARGISDYVFNATLIAVRWFAALLQTVQHVFESALAWPIELFRMQEWLIVHGIPNAIRAAIRGIHGSVTYVTKVLPALRSTVYKFPKLTKKLAQQVIVAALPGLLLGNLRIRHWIERLIRAVAIPLIHALPRPRAIPIPSLHKLFRRWSAAWLLSSGVAALALALGKLGLGWIRCRNVTRLGRRVCGMDSSLLDTLLLDALTVFSVVSVVEFTKDLRAIEDEAIGVMGKLVREWPS